MRDKIIHKSTELFLTLGFKSVTMDDIANELGISKKTIYVHFSNKTKLVEAVTFHLFDTICDGIDDICDNAPNPIEELYSIKMFVMQHLQRVVLQNKITWNIPMKKHISVIFAMQGLDGMAI